MSVHNLRTEKMQPGDVYVGRPNAKVRRGVEGADGYFGNPFTVEDWGRYGALMEFERHATERAERDEGYRDRVAALYGKRLFCWCAPETCHAQILERLSERLVTQLELFP